MTVLRKALAESGPFILAMILIIALSNVLVQYPFTPFGLEAWLTWGALAYPFTFLVNDLANRARGAAFARRVVLLAFPLALLVSWVASDSWRIAAASLCAWLAAQWLDIAIFDRLRGQNWWRAPLLSSLLASLLDTALFFSIAFAGTTGRAVYMGGLPAPLWVGWAAGDLLFKALAACLLLAPYRLALARLSARAL